MVFSMYLACLLSLCQYLINVKKFNRSGPNVFFAPHKTLGKVHKPLIVKINNVSWKKVDIIFDNLPIQKELRQNFRTIKVGGYQLNVQNVDRKGGHWYFYLDFWTDTSLPTFNLCNMPMSNIKIIYPKFSPFTGFENLEILLHIWICVINGFLIMVNLT